MFAQRVLTVSRQFKLGDAERVETADNVVAHAVDETPFALSGNSFLLAGVVGGL